MVFSTRNVQRKAISRLDAPLARQFTPGTRLIDGLELVLLNDECCSKFLSPHKHRIAIALVLTSTGFLGTFNLCIVLQPSSYSRSLRSSSFLLSDYTNQLWKPSYKEEPCASTCWYRDHTLLCNVCTRQLKCVPPFPSRVCCAYLFITCLSLLF
jgi:hypothetical protein